MYRLLLIVFMIVAVVALPAAAQEPTSQPDEVAEDIVDTTVQVAEETAEEVDSLIDRLTSAPQSDIARVLLVIGGVVLLVAGWRVYDFIVIIAGMLIGASIGISLVTNDSEVIRLAALLMGALVGAVISVFLYYLAVFVIGAYVGVLLTNSAAVAFSLTPVSGLALLIGAVIGGIVLLSLSFEFLVLLSSIVGAQMLSLGLGLDAVWTLIFAIAGIIIQFGLMRSFNYDFRRRPRRRLFPRLA